MNNRQLLLPETDCLIVSSEIYAKSRQVRRRERFFCSQETTACVKARRAGRPDAQEMPTGFVMRNAFHTDRQTTKKKKKKTSRVKSFVATAVLSQRQMFKSAKLVTIKINGNKSWTTPTKSGGANIEPNSERSPHIAVQRRPRQQRRHSNQWRAGSRCCYAGTHGWRRT